MEIKLQLNKPYTEEQRIEFIVEQNHNNGYEIRETETAIEAWGYTQEEITEQEKEIRLSELKKELEDLDKKRVRAVCEPSMKTETQSWLEYYNEQVAQIRQVMARL